MDKLNQVIAVEKSVKSRAHSEVSELYKIVQKSTLFNGLSRQYFPKDEDGETNPSEYQKAQENAEKILKKLQNSKTELFDITAQKDYANTSATASIMIDGMPIVENAPVPYLLFLEKEFTDLRTFIANLPVLDATEDWSKDEKSGVYKTEPTRKNSTKKVQKAIVLYDATEKHPAQTQLITDDVNVGAWETVKYSGAIPRTEQEELLERIEKLINATKFAREEANQTDAHKVSVGEHVFRYLLS